MKKCLIVGADHIGTKSEYLCSKYGVTEILHWTGRGRKLPCLPLVDLVVVITQYVNHSLMYHVKKEARKMGAQTIFIRRGISELERCA